MQAFLNALSYKTLFIGQGPWVLLILFHFLLPTSFCSVAKGKGANRSHLLYQFYGFLKMGYD